MNFKIDKSKTINSLLYIINSLSERGIEPKIHKVMKMLYFADRKHLVEYGFPITGDTYLKMKYGPVPSFAYDVTKERENIIRKNNHTLSTDKKPDLEDLSESEIECLKSVIDEYSNISFERLTEISHQLAWNSADWQIDYLNMAREGGADEGMMDYIKHHMLNDNISVYTV